MFVSVASPTLPQGFHADQTLGRQDSSSVTAAPPGRCVAPGAEASLRSVPLLRSAWAQLSSVVVGLALPIADSAACFAM